MESAALLHVPHLAVSDMDNKKKEQNLNNQRKASLSQTTKSVIIHLI